MKNLKLVNLILVLMILATLIGTPARAAVSLPQIVNPSASEVVSLESAHPTRANAPAVGSVLPLIDDFQSGLSWFQYNGGLSWISNQTVLTTTLGAAGVISNTVLSVGYSVGDYAGSGKDLIPAQDWSGYDGLSFWARGSNSGTVFKIILSDNKNGAGDTAERISTSFTDNFTGWKHLSFPWQVFGRDNGYQPGGAPNDGLTLTEMNALAFAPQAGSGTLYLDQLGLYKTTGTVLDSFQNGLTWFQYNGGGSWIANQTVLTNTLSAVGVISNTVLSLGYSVNDYAGSGKDLIPAQDWSGYDGLSFWARGMNSGTVFKIILSDNKNGAGDTAERISTSFTDNFTGWKYLSFPWQVFGRDNGYQPGGAPNDGLTLTEMNALAFAPQAGSGTLYLDQLGLYRNAIQAAGLTVQLSSNVYSVAEGATASITTTLSMTATYPVTVTYATSAGTAAAGTDFTALNSQLVFLPGEQQKVLSLVTIDNSTVNPNKTLTLALTNPVSATLGSPKSAVITIVDNDVANPATSLVDMVDDFQRTDLPTAKIPVDVSVGYYNFNATGASIAMTLTTSTAANRPASPTILTPQSLKLDMTVPQGKWAGFVHGFENADLTQWLSQDWSTHTGVSFWLYGNNTGGVLFLDVLDNRKPGSTSDDAERWSIDIPDNFSGWKYFEIPFGSLHRKDVGNSAPNDGLNLTEVHGYAIGAYGSVDMGTHTYYVDNFGLLIRTTGVDDFERSTLPTATIPTQIPIGYYTFNADGAGAGITVTANAPAPVLLAPQAPQAPNRALKLSMNVPAGKWAGFVHAFENQALDQWVPQDWSTYQGIAFWLYGNNTGGVIFVDVLDNRKPGSTTDDAERWSIDLQDNFSGWKYFQIPFSSLHRKDVGNGAPSDGLTLSEVHGYGVGAYGSVDMGTHDYYLDNVIVYGDTGANRPLEVGFSPVENKVTEGITATISVILNRVSTLPVQVSYATQTGSAIVDRDYLAASGTLTFAPGIKEMTFDITTFDNSKWSANKTVRLLISNPISATLGLAKQTDLVIVNNDPFNPALVDDFESSPYFFRSQGQVGLSNFEVANGVPMALPGQGSYENLLQVTYDSASNPAVFGRTFAQSQNWSAYNGMSFWYYGQASGEPITVTLQENRQPDPGPAGWTQVWSDEFNGAQGSAVNSNNWTHEIGGQGWGNGEWEYYTNSTENSAMNGAGSLVITATAVDTATTSLNCWYGACKYTSARLVTTNKLEFAYGRAEALIQVPKGQGIWPAFWMLGNDLGTVGWPVAGEIDIMENIGREPNIVHGTVHGPGYSGGSGIGGGYTLPSGNLADGYHLYAVEWEPTQIRWFIDSTQYFTVTTADLPGGADWVYDHPFFLILNLAVGGAWPGYPDNTTVFPQTMKVDYVRVYQAPDSAERFETAFVDNFSGWRKVNLPLQAFNRSADQPAGAPADGLTLSEVWGYGFRLPAGKQGVLYFDQVLLEQFKMYFMPIWFR